MKNSKWNGKLIIALGVLSVLVLINILVSLQDGGIKDVTGSVVEEAGKGSYDDLANEVARLKSDNEKIVVEKNDLSKKISELEAKIKVFEEEKEIEKESCPLPCGVDEICSPINKKDGSVEWQCVDDPAKFV